MTENQILSSFAPRHIGDDTLMHYSPTRKVNLPICLTQAEITVRRVDFRRRMYILPLCLNWGLFLRIDQRRLFHRRWCWCWRRSNWWFWLFAGMKEHIWRVISQNSVKGDDNNRSLPGYAQWCTHEESRQPYPAPVCTRSELFLCREAAPESSRTYNFKERASFRQSWSFFGIYMNVWIWSF